VVVIMRRRTFGIIAIVVGVLLMGFAPILRWGIAPNLTVLPGDLNTTRVFTGTAAVLANPTALSGTTVGPAILRNVPITVTHADKVLKTSGDNALVKDTRIVTMPGFTVANLVYNVSVDRKNFHANTAMAGALPATGIVFNFPIGTKTHNYTGWVADTGTTVPLTYMGKAKRGGISTYVFQEVQSAARITDPQLLKLLPATATKADLLRQVPAFGFSAAQLKQLSDLMVKLPDPVSLAYTFSDRSTFWVDPKTGVVVDVQRHEVRAANFVLGSALIPMSAIMDFTYTSTPATLKAATNDAKNNASGMTLITDTLPAVSLTAGAVLFVIGIGLVAYRRRPTATPPVQPMRELEPVN
jgi:hypothetical protein